jgi:hypothetical protein
VFGKWDIVTRLAHLSMKEAQLRALERSAEGREKGKRAEHFLNSSDGKKESEVLAMYTGVFGNELEAKQWPKVGSKLISA